MQKMKYWDGKTIEKIRKGFYSAIYFNRTQQILLQEKNVKTVTMQVFQKQYVTVCGIDQVRELLQVATGYYDHKTWIGKWETLQVQTLRDGVTVSPWETVMHITGPYAYFAHLESVYLGILARQTKVATNTKKVVTAASGKQVIFFADRFDYFLNQEIDGYAAKIGGITGVATPAQAALWNGTPSGTIPHALIAINMGDTTNSASQFEKYFPNAPLIVLVDFRNNCVQTALEVARKFGKKLWGVRLDTSETIIDISLQSRHDTTLKGVHKELVKNVRQALDKEGFKKVKIVVSGGFTAEKITSFENEHIPVDAYGVGSSLLRENIDFTADIVKVEGKEIAKEGRGFKENIRLQIIR